MAAKNKVGRPSKIDEVKLQKLREAFLMGYSDEEACKYADLAPSTFYDFQKKNSEILKCKQQIEFKCILNRHRNNVNRLDCLRRRKFEIIKKYELKDSDISGIPTNTLKYINYRDISEKERAAIMLTKFNEDIKALTPIVNEEQARLEGLIDKLEKQSKDHRHADILRRYYIDGGTIQDIILEHYGVDNKTTRSSIDGLRKTAEKLLNKLFIANTF